MVMGFKIPRGTTVAPTPRLMQANAADVPLVLVETPFGGSRIVDMLVGDPLPRIC